MWLVGFSNAPLASGGFPAVTFVDVTCGAVIAKFPQPYQQLLRNHRFWNQFQVEDICWFSTVKFIKICLDYNFTQLQPVLQEPNPVMPDFNNQYQPVDVVFDYHQSGGTNETNTFVQPQQQSLYGSNTNPVVFDQQPADFYNQSVCIVMDFGFRNQKTFFKFTSHDTAWDNLPFSLFNPEPLMHEPKTCWAWTILRIFNHLRPISTMLWRHQLWKPSIIIMVVFRWLVARASGTRRWVWFPNPISPGSNSTRYKILTRVWFTWNMTPVSAKIHMVTRAKRATRSLSTTCDVINRFICYIIQKYSTKRALNGHITAKHRPLAAKSKSKKPMAPTTRNWGPFEQEHDSEDEYDCLKWGYFS